MPPFPPALFPGVPACPPPGPHRRGLQLNGSSRISPAAHRTLYGSSSGRSARRSHPSCSPPSPPPVPRDRTTPSMIPAGKRCGQVRLDQPPHSAASARRHIPSSAAIWMMRPPATTEDFPLRVRSESASLIPGLAPDLGTGPRIRPAGSCGSVTVVAHRVPGLHAHLATRCRCTWRPASPRAAPAPVPRCRAFDPVSNRFTYSPVALTVVRPGL
jgi:hypothetical protein